MLSQSGLLRQASAMALMGGSAYAVRFLGDRALSDLPAPIEATRYLRHHKPLARALRHLCKLEQEELFADLVQRIEGILELLQSERNSGVGVGVHTEATRAQVALDRILTAAKRGASDRRLEACVECAEEHIPCVKDILDSFVHNAILDHCMGQTP